MSVSPFFGSLTRMPRTPGAWRVGLRAGVTLLIALLVLWSMGRLDWAIYASFGGFASIFGRTVPLPQRLRVQTEAGLSIIIALLLGVVVSLFAERAWLVIPVAAAYATLCAIVSHRRNWHPPGPLFQVFSMGSAASTPHHVGDLVPAVIVSLLAMLLALVLTYAASLLGHLWRRHVLHVTQPWPHAPLQAGTGPGEVQQWPFRHYVIRYAVGILVAGGIATAVGIGRPYWAMVGAVVPMAAPNAHARTVRGVHRLIGTLIGVGVIWVILKLDPPTLVLIVIMAALQVGAELFVGRNYGIAMMFVTPLALGMVQIAHPLPVDALIVDRTIETFLGVAVALIITLLTRERVQRCASD